MSGIAGEITIERRPDIGAVATMNACQQHRGGDGHGVWSSRNVAFGHERLAVIDLARRADQPMHDAQLGLTIVFDGCVYNYRDLRDELEAKGYAFASTSDTEVLLKGYHAWGREVLDRVHGMFAFAIAERDSGTVVLGRDRLGIKPLYLADVDGGLRFASSLPALVRAGGVDTRIDPVALHHYLTFHAVVPAPRTILRGVRKLDAGTVLTVRADGTQHTHRYWTPSFERRTDRAGWSARDWEDATLEAVRTAVRRRVVADVPVGALLSGGVDSSLIVGILAEDGHDDLKTFTIGFDAAGGESGNEFSWAQIVAKHFGTDHAEIHIGEERMLPALGDAIGAMSEPMVSHDAVAFYLLSQEVAKHATVVQSGQGADEVFAGYHWYPPLAEVDAGDLGGALDAYRAAFFDRSHDELLALVQPQWATGSDVSLDFVREHFGTPGAATHTDRALRIDSTVMAVDDPVKRVDNMTMAWGLEARMPFLDHELVELAATCPPEFKTAQGGKGVLKEAARRVIPDAVIDREKGYFPVPALKHLQGPYLDLVRDALHSEAARERGLFRPEAVTALLDDPNGSLTPLRGNRLWQLGLLELWLQRHGIGGAAL